MLSFPLLEIELYPRIKEIQNPEFEITLYNIRPYSNELEKSLIERYKSEGNNAQE